MKALKLATMMLVLGLASACGDDGDSGDGGGDSAGDGGGMSGACTNDADRAIIDDASVELLGCEGSKCAVKALASGADGAFTTDVAKLTACVAEDAPTLKQLSAECQKCFVEITECVPETCVMLFGAETNACFDGTVPSDKFEDCAEPPSSTAECNECQKPCQTKFVECSGLEP